MTDSTKPMVEPECPAGPDCAVVRDRERTRRAVLLKSDDGPESGNQ